MRAREGYGDWCESETLRKGMSHEGQRGARLVSML
jgi:hypothetical protein